jgi:hypothetical protein
LLYGLRENLYATLLNSNPANELSLSKEANDDGGNNEIIDGPLVELSLVGGSGGVGSVYQGEVIDYEDGDAQVINNISVRFYKASKDILVYQVRYFPDSALELEEDGLGYEQGVLIRSTDDL